MYGGRACGEALGGGFQQAGLVGEDFAGEAGDEGWIGCLGVGDFEDAGGVSGERGGKGVEGGPVDGAA